MVPSPAQQLTRSDLEAFVDGIMSIELKRENIAGAAISVVKDGQILFEKGYGYSDTATKRPVSVETIFRPGSISKLFTWTAVMQLVEQGKLNLDGNVNDYLDFKIPDTYPQPVTLRHLMTHTAGFEEVDKDLILRRASDVPSLRKYLISHVPRRIFPPGTTPAYSNYGAALAGYVVERVSGLAFPQYIEEFILNPLQMRHSTFVQPLPASLAPFTSRGYDLASDPPKDFELIPALPAGSMSVTAHDIAHFMIAHLQDGRYENRQILRPETIELMHRRQRGSHPEINGMALGFYEESHNGLRIIGHGGDTGWFHSDLHLVPSENLGFFVTYNSAGRGDADPREMLFQQFLDRYFPFSPPPTPPPATAASDAKALSGDYLVSRRCDSCILRISGWLNEAKISSQRDNSLTIDVAKYPNGQPVHLREIAPLVYRDGETNDLMAFQPLPNGRFQAVFSPNVFVINSVPWYWKKNFLLIVLVAMTAVFALTLLAWPAAALIRRHYAQAWMVDRGSRRLHRAGRLVCLLNLVVIGLWTYFFSRALDDISVLSTRNDGLLHSLQVLGIITLLGTAFPLGAFFRSWRRAGTWWWTRLWNAVVLLSSLAYAGILILGGLLDWSLRY